MNDVLIVDDNEINVQLAGHLVRKLGYSVSTASSGRAAVAMSAKADFQLILMDVQMPDVDGIEATRQIRSREIAGSRRTPIVGLSASDSTEVRRECMSAGMDDYLGKPIDVMALKGCLLRWAAAPRGSGRNDAGA